MWWYFYANRLWGDDAFVFVYKNWHLFCYSIDGQKLKHLLYTCAQVSTEKSSKKDPTVGLLMSYLNFVRFVLSQLENLKLPVFALQRKKN